MPNATGCDRHNRLLAILDWIAYLVLIAGVGLALGVALLAAALLLLPVAAAAEAAPHPGLILKSARDTVSAPLLDTEVHIRVSGMVARATVRQSFRNPSGEWREGIYVFPLPEDAAVDHLTMRIGKRVVAGEIREREAARAHYERAKHGGQRAALVQQERPNVFTSAVANIAPHEHIQVDIEYQQVLRYENGDDAGSYRLRFPMVVAPRYMPGTPTGRQGAGWAADTDLVPDASRITLPVLPPAPGMAPINPVRIKVDLDAGVPLDAIDSPYHAIRVQRLGASRAAVELAQGTAPAERDFELVWRLAPSHAPRAALFTERRGDVTYALLMMLPPAAPALRQRLPREVIFIIDTSGSMAGTSIVQAREALTMAVTRLDAGDRFNIIEFNSHARALFPDAVAADQGNRRRVLQFVDALRANGGTEMAAALNLALNGRENPGRVRQVVFLTDGAVGNEEQLFSLISDKLGDSRLFTVGIGSAPRSRPGRRACPISTWASPWW